MSIITLFQVLCKVLEHKNFYEQTQEASLCFGLYVQAQQIGFSRAITDSATRRIMHIARKDLYKNK